MLHHDLEYLFTLLHKKKIKLCISHYMPLSYVHEITHVYSQNQFLLIVLAPTLNYGYQHPIRRLLNHFLTTIA